MGQLVGQLMHILSQDMIQRLRQVDLMEVDGPVRPHSWIHSIWIFNSCLILKRLNINCLHLLHHMTRQRRQLILKLDIPTLTQTPMHNTRHILIPMLTRTSTSIHPLMP